MKQVSFHLVTDDQFKKRDQYEFGGQIVAHFPKGAFEASRVKEQEMGLMTFRNALIYAL